MIIVLGFLHAIFGLFWLILFVLYIIPVITSLSTPLLYGQPGLFFDLFLLFMLPFNVICAFLISWLFYKQRRRGRHIALLYDGLWFAFAVVLVAGGDTSVPTYTILMVGVPGATVLLCLSPQGRTQLTK